MPMWCRTLKQIEPNVGLRDVIAHGQVRLEEEARFVRIGHRDPADDNANVPRALQDVNAGVRIARMNVDLLVLLGASVHRRPMEADVAADFVDG
jgi:hypothetical protein